jgi:phosphoglycerate dehydrogenase-like enzyme
MLSVDCHNGGWIIESEEKNVTDLFDITIGVIGAGWAGSHYISLLRNFYAEILLYDPYVTKEKAARMGACKVELEELLRRSDLVSIHAPSIPETDNMINAGTLKLMKKDAVLINTARGSIINEADLYEHMAKGNLKYACLDVFKPEPPAPDHPLRSLPNVIITPHIAGLSDNGRRRIGLHVANEIENFLNGKPMETEVTQEMLNKMA